tara:strand:- start:177 stop:371 length:195 start_codon:yes stop_codon:yes gene_type:complete
MTYLQAGVYFVKPISGSPTITVDDAEYTIPAGYSFTICVKNYMSVDATTTKFSKLPTNTIAMAT